MKKYNVELSQDEIFILQVSLQDSKKFKESFRLEDEGNDLTGLTKSLNDSVDKSVKEREDLYNKLHEVIFDSDVDTITISHSARSRDGFASGALRAAKWLIAEKRAGLFSMDDLINNIFGE